MEPSQVDDDVPGSTAWWAARGERQSRRRPRVAGLTTERITDAALVLVDHEGLEALTVRRLADQLGTGSASLYRHVASRDELLVLLVDHVLGDVVLPDAERSPRSKLEHLAGELRRVLMAHASLLPALSTSPMLGPNAVRGVDAGLTYAIEAGFAPDHAVPATMTLIDYVLGTVFFDTSRAAQDSPEEVFAFGLAALLDGLDARRQKCDQCSH